MFFGPLNLKYHCRFVPCVSDLLRGRAALLFFMLTYFGDIYYSSHCLARGSESSVNLRGAGMEKTGVFYTLGLAVMNFDLDLITNAWHLDRVMMSPVPGDRTSLWSTHILLCVYKEACLTLIWESNELFRPPCQAKAFSSSLVNENLLCDS